MQTPTRLIQHRLIPRHATHPEKIARHRPRAYDSVVKTESNPRSPWSPRRVRSSWRRRLVALGVVAVLGLVAWSRWGYFLTGPPNVVIADSTSHISIPTDTCSAPDTSGAVNGAGTCMRSTFVLEPTRFLTVAPGQRLSISLSGSGFDFALLRLARPVLPDCPGTLLTTIRLAGNAPATWTAPKAPGPYTVRLVFNSVGQIGTITAVIGLVIKPLPSGVTRLGCPA